MADGSLSGVERPAEQDHKSWECEDQAPGRTHFLSPGSEGQA